MSHVIKLNKAERRQIDAVEALLKPWGLSYELEHTSHLMMVIAGPSRNGKPGGKWRLTIACTPKDPDQALRYVRANARKVLHDINRRLGL